MAEIIIKEDAGVTYKVIDKNDDGIVEGNERVVKDSPDSKGKTEYKPGDPNLLKELGLPHYYTSLKGIAVADLAKYFKALGYKGETLPERIEEIKKLEFGSQARLEEVHVLNPIDPAKSYYKGSTLDISVAVTDAKEGEDIYANIAFGGATIKRNVKIGTGNGTFTVPVFAANEAGVFCRKLLDDRKKFSDLLSGLGGLGTRGNVPTKADELIDSFTVNLVEKKAGDTFGPLANRTEKDSTESVRLKAASGATAAVVSAPRIPAKKPAAPARTPAPAPVPASGGLND